MNFKFLLCFIILLSATSLHLYAQDNHFIYLQSDNKQAFYVKLNNKIYSSNAAGYTIIPKLAEGKAELQIGFPRNQYPAQYIQLNIDKDKGYALKKMSEEKWGLFNLQTLQTQYTATSKEVATAADVITKQAIVQKELELAVAKNEEISADKKEDNQSRKEDSPATETVKADINKQPKAISKTQSGITGNTYTAMYKMGEGEETEFIEVSIDFPTEVFIKKPIAQPEKNKTVLSPKTDNQFLDLELENPNTKAEPVIPTKSASTEDYSKGKLNFNSDCKNFASDDDVFELRQAMVSKRTDEEMVSTAVKNFKKRCYTTAQLKILDNILMSETGKLSLIKAAYPFVSDPQNFASLESEFTTVETRAAFRSILY